MNADGRELRKSGHRDIGKKQKHSPQRTLRTQRRVAGIAGIAVIAGIGKARALTADYADERGWEGAEEIGASRHREKPHDALPNYAKDAKESLGDRRHRRNRRNRKGKSFNRGLRG